MPAYVTALNVVLDAFGGEAAYVSLHTGTEITDPTSPSEVTGGSPAYARKAITWDAASTGNLNSSNQPVIDVPSGAAVTRVGFWNHATDQTVAAFVGQIALGSTITFTTQGTFTITDCDWSAV